MLRGHRIGDGIRSRKWASDVQIDGSKSDTVDDEDRSGMCRANQLPRERSRLR